ncbi:MAG: DUF3108 domain-containing protein [Dechloromonas sp.]|nr:DUF3108 domain-containing protein [Dechloromonas sp.]
MPLFLLGALASSLALHGLVLFGQEIELPGLADEPLPLQAELRWPPPPAPAPEIPTQPVPPPAKAVAVPSKPAALRSPQPVAAVNSPAVVGMSQEHGVAPLPHAVAASPAQPSRSLPALAHVAPRQPAHGVIRYDVTRGEQGFIIGRAEHRWSFDAAGRYHLRGVTETSGLVALFKRLRLEFVSDGQLTASGLQPRRFQSIKNGQMTESADFDWGQGLLHWSAEPAGEPLRAGSQDVLSLNYQLAYLPNPENGSRMPVFTGRKYAAYAIDALGEDVLETPAGSFRTLHLRVMTETLTEIWLALDHHRLPVKIRFTDKKGDRYEQVARELGTE